ncbi:hypothetical protein [Xanthobacter sp. KR7-225]|uniref:hypothetical protein n=1 Tax=Xanthobacter sp. KR7-225 TaxID=3156613 RepID=UPI0032B52183
MAETLDTSVVAPSDAPRGRARGESTRVFAPLATPLAIWAMALFGGALFAAAVLLWMRHGVSVFFDTLTAGIGSCL